MDLTNANSIVSAIELLGSVASIISLVHTITARGPSNPQKSITCSPSTDSPLVTEVVNQEMSFLPQTDNSLVYKEDDDIREKNKSPAANRRLVGAEATDLDH